MIVFKAGQRKANVMARTARKRDTDPGTPLPTVLPEIEGPVAPDQAHDWP